MASTNKTANLGLSQWEATDAFSREDLNSDFKAVDKALGGQMVKLADITLEADSISVTVDLSDIDLAGFVELHVFMPEKVNIKPNDFSGTYQYYASGSWSSGTIDPISYSGHCTVRNIYGLDGTKGSTLIVDNFIYYAAASDIGKLRKLTITKMNNHSISAGERVLVLGLKI